MKIIVTLLLVFLFNANGLKASNEFLKLNYSCSNSHSGFDKVNIIDKRVGKQMLGLIQVGGFNRMEEVKFFGSFTDSLTKFFLSSDSIKKNGRELTIILYELFISEQISGLSEVGRLKISMRLFENIQQDKFQEIMLVDSIFITQAGDVTKKLMRSVSERLCDIAGLADAKGTSDKFDSSTYTLYQLHSLDSLEKLRIPIYNTETYSPGIFIDYNHFKNNISDNSIITFDTTLNGKIRVYKWDVKKKKKIKLKIGSFYAVCDSKLIIKSTSIGFYTLEKIESDFYYTGKTAFFSSGNNAALFGVMFGLTGAIIASTMDNKEQMFRLKINYLSGHSIPVSLVK